MNKNIINLALATALAVNPLVTIEAKVSIEAKASTVAKQTQQHPQTNISNNEKRNTPATNYRQSNLELAKVSEQLTRHKIKNDNSNRNVRIGARDAYLAISDSNLRSCVKSKVTQMGISYADELSQLFCGSNQISSLAGIEPFTGLTFVEFGYNNISDITPLANLTNLTHAILWQNQISDISTATTWPSLYELDISSNPITDVSALNNHASLTRLFVGNSGYTINDLSPLSTITQLQWLGIFDNQLTNTDFTLGMNNLELLDVRDNPITDVSALANLNNLNELFLVFTQVSDLSPVLTSTNQYNWFSLYGTQSVYCWQQDYAQNQPNINYFEASSQCDASTDFDDFDNDGIPNHYEVMQGTDPFGPIAPPPSTDMLFIDAINALSDIQLQSCLNLVHSQTSYTYANELTSLNCNGYNIVDLTGIDNFENLTELLLANNQISYFEPAPTLSQLQTLDLTDNNISYIESIVQATSLIDLKLANNPITNFYPLSQLTSLQVLDLADTALNYVFELETLTNLTTLDITNTGITTVDPLATLVNLTSLRMDFNAVNDASAVLQLTDNWQQLSLGSQTYCWQLDYVEAFATVNNWQRPPGCDFGNEYGDFDNDGISNADEIAYNSNPFSASPPSALTYDNALAYISDGQLFNCLFSAKQLHQMASDLTELNCIGQNINNINGLEHFTGLTQLDLAGNNIVDITPINSLSALQILFIPNNLVSDISPLAGLNQLNELWLYENNVSDITALAATSALREAILFGNPISDVSPLGGLNQLTHVDLYQTPVTSLSGFESLTTLEFIDISDTGVTDISPLANATSLEYLLAQNTQVVDVGPVIQLPNTWVLLILAENTYCWQLEYINMNVTVSNYMPPTSCDLSDDFNDLDNDGVFNFDEVIQGRDPFNADILPPPATIIEGINALADGPLANCIFNAESSRLNDPIENLQLIMCGGQNINQLDGMANFTGLLLLDISNTNVTSLEPLRGMNNLETLFSDGSPLSSIDAINELPALFDVGLSHSTMADVSVLFSVPNTWQALSFSEHNYCWQVSYADSALNLSYFAAAPTCDSSDDLNDADNDGISNIDEVNQGSSPFSVN